MGIIILFYPLRAIIMWLVIWGAITALLRPLSGEPFAEFIERAGNFGAPLALIILSGSIFTFKKMVTPLKPVHRNRYKNTANSKSVFAICGMLSFYWSWMAQPG